MKFCTALALKKYKIKALYKAVESLESQAAIKYISRLKLHICTI